MATFNKLLTRAFLLPLLFTVALGLLFLWQSATLIQSSRWVDRTDRSISTSRFLTRSILDMETGLRGYLLTGQEVFLEPYIAAEKRIPQLFQEVRALSDDSDQLRILQHTEGLFQEWLRYSRELIDLRRSGRDYGSLERNLAGKRLMDTIRLSREDFVARQERLREQQVERFDWRVRVLFGSGIAVTIGFGLLLAVLTRGQLKNLASTYADAIELAEHRAEELRESNEFISTTLASIGDGVVATDAEGNIAFMNRVAEETTGWRWQEALGKPLNEVVKVVDEISRASLDHVVHDAVKNGSPRTITTRQGILLRRDGTETPVDESIAAIVDRDHNLLGVALAVRDLTRQRRSEEALRSSERLATLGRLASSVVHEINSPLDSLANLLYLLEHQSGLDETGRQQIKLASEEVGRISQIVRNMLGFNRSFATPIPIRVSEVLDAILLLYDARIRTANVVVHKRYDIPGTVVAQPVELRQIFSNLIVNAVDASQRGARLKIHVKPSRDWKQPDVRGVRILIADSGVGISREDQGRIMNPFFTTKGERGTGLGLWVTRGIVEKYGGSIRFHSTTRPGRHGTCFSVFIPSEQAAAEVPTTEKQLHLRLAG